MDEQKLLKEFKQILGLYTADNRELPSWEQIFNEIGKLQERATQNDKIQPFPTFTPSIPISEPPFHYHNGVKCYQNPCFWCGTGG